MRPGLFIKLQYAKKGMDKAYFRTRQFNFQLGNFDESYCLDIVCWLDFIAAVIAPKHLLLGYN
jgi:hypothetical protein